MKNSVTSLPFIVLHKLSKAKEEFLYCVLNEFIANTMFVCSTLQCCLTDSRSVKPLQNVDLTFHA